MNNELGVWTYHDCALVLIDYQKEIFATIRSDTRADLVELNVRLLARTARAFNMPIVLSTVGVAAGINGSTQPAILSELPGVQVLDRTTMNAFEDVAFADSSLPQIDVDVTIVEELGSDTHVIFPVDAPRVETEELRDAALGQEATLLAEDRAVFNARVDPRTDASRGRPLRLAVDPDRFYFFDPATGENMKRTQRLADGERRQIESAAATPE